jgi:hypothetical protein
MSAATPHKSTHVAAKRQAPRPRRDIVHATGGRQTITTRFTGRRSLRPPYRRTLSAAPVQPIVRLHGSSAVCPPVGDQRPFDLRSSYRTAEAAAIIGASAPPLAILRRCERSWQANGIPFPSQFLGLTFPCQIASSSRRLRGGDRGKGHPKPSGETDRWIWQPDIFPAAMTVRPIVGVRRERPAMEDAIAGRAGRSRAAMGTAELAAGRSRQVPVSFWWTEKLRTEKWEQPRVPKGRFFCHQCFCQFVPDPWIPDRLTHGPCLSEARTAWPPAEGS